MASTNYHIVNSPAHFQELLSADLNRVSLINFWAPWAAPCEQMNEVVIELAKKYPTALVLQVEAKNRKISQNPSRLTLFHHLLFCEDIHCLSVYLAQTPPAITQAVAKHVAGPSYNPQSRTDQAPAPPSNVNLPVGSEKQETQEELNERMQAIMNKSKVVLLMKGTPEAPRCGFSRKLSSTLKDNNITFTHFNILSDENVRQGFKVLNNWPTFPQLIIDGELVGGLDIVQEMVESGELAEMTA